MAGNYNIALGVQSPKIDSPVNALANVLQIKGAQQQNQLGQMKMDEYGRGVERQNKLREILQGTDPSQLQDALLRGGFMDESQARGKYSADIGKTAAETGAKEVETLVNATRLHRDQLAGVNDPQAAAQWVSAGYQDPVLSKLFGKSGSLQDAIQRIPQDPQAFENWKQQNALGASEFIKQNTPRYQTSDVGGSTNTYANPGLGGPSQLVNSVKNTQSPDNAASQAQSNRNNLRSVWASLENARANREIAGAQRESTQAWQQQDRDQSKSAAISTVEDSIRVVQKALDHPGRETATGVSGTIDPRNYLPATDAKNFLVVLEQIKGKAFLQAFQSLKGGGQITEVEGNKATAAITRMDTAQSDAEFKTALNDLMDVMKKGYERLTGKKYQSPEGAKSAGRTIKRTGKIDGKKVIEYSDGTTEYAN